MMNEVEQRAVTLAPASAEDQLFVNSALSIGRRLCDGAIHDGGTCTWTITTPDPADPWSRATVQTSAGSGLYQGTAGIALFLTELFRITGEPAMRVVGEAALRYSIERLSKSALRGFFSGRTGIAYAAARYALCTGDEEFRELALRILTEQRSLETADPMHDVIAGAAGAIPVLLLLARWLEEPALGDSACELGDSLVASARKTVIGWSLPSNNPAYSGDLTGLAHGAAGLGYALLELAMHSGRADYRYAADQAFLYERHRFVTSQGNWPDLRNSALGEAITHPDRREKLRTALREGAEPPFYKPFFMVAWCHGAPGIGLTRLRAYDLTGDLVRAEEAAIAVRTTEAGSDRLATHCLCHGVFGNDATLLAAARSFQEPRWRANAVARAATACDRYEVAGRRWVSGILGGGPDPSLMVGEAGIGYHLLTLADEGVPNILLVTPPRDERALARLRLETTPQTRVIVTPDPRSSHVRRFFDVSLRVADRLAPEVPLFPRATPVTPHDDVIGQLYADLSDVLTGPYPAVLREQLADASRVERAVYESSLTLLDFTRTLVEDLRRIPTADIKWDVAEFRLDQSVRLIEQQFDWDTYLRDTSESDDTRLTRQSPQKLLFASSSVVFHRGDQVRVERIGSFTLALLIQLRRPSSLEEITRRLSRRYHLNSADRDRVRQNIESQLNRAYDAGIVVMSDRMVPVGRRRPKRSAQHTQE